MFTKILYIETITNGYKEEFLGTASLTAILFGIFVIISKNPIVSVLFLIGLFSAIASSLILSGYTFIGLSYLLVYIGAISILFLFILMLINVRVSELTSDTSNSIPLAIMGGLSFIYSVYEILPFSTKGFSNFFVNLMDNLANLKDILANFINLLVILKTINNNVYVTSTQWDGNLGENSDITSIGNILYTNYAVWLIITSLILLLAMVGSICLVVKYKSQYFRQDIK